VQKPQPESVLVFELNVSCATLASSASSSSSSSSSDSNNELPGRKVTSEDLIWRPLKTQENWKVLVDPDRLCKNGQPVELFTLPLGQRVQARFLAMCSSAYFSGNAAYKHICSQSFIREVQLEPSPKTSAAPKIVNCCPTGALEVRNIEEAHLVSPWLCQRDVGCNTCGLAETRASVEQKGKSLRWLWRIQVKTHLPDVKFAFRRVVEAYRTHLVAVWVKALRRDFDLNWDQALFWKEELQKTIV
jgi:hypothetical protein